MSGAELSQTTALHHSPLGYTVREYEKARRVLLSCAIPLCLALFMWALSAMLSAVASPEISIPRVAFLAVALACTSAALAFVLYLTVEALSLLQNAIRAGHDLWRSNTILLPPPGTTLSSLGAWELSVTESEISRQGTVLRVRYAGRMGNNLFQYVTARLRAAYLDIAFESPPLGGLFSALPVSVHRWQPAQTPQAPEQCRRCHSMLLRQRLDVQAGSARGKHALLPPAWLTLARDRLLAPCSTFSMDCGSLIGHEAEVAAWIRPIIMGHATALMEKEERDTKQVSCTASTAARLPASPTLPFQHNSAPCVHFSANDVAVHVRVGDIVWGVHAAYTPLPHSFYRAALGNIVDQLRVSSHKGSRRGVFPPDARPPLGAIVIVTESPRHAIVQQLAAHLQDLRWGEGKGVCIASATPAGGSSVVEPSGRLCECVRIQSSSASGDMSTLALAPSLVLSVSSFAWWPAAVGLARAVIVPEWGLLYPHEWQPDSRAHPHLFVTHDMSFPHFPTAKTRKAGQGGREGMSRKYEGGSSGSAMQDSGETAAWAASTVAGFALAKSLAAGLTLTRARQVAQEQQEGASSRTVVYMPLKSLARWPGNMKPAIDALRD